MPTIHTLTHPSLRKEFSYTGSVTEGVILELEFIGKPSVSAELFHAIIHKFKGETIPGGFCMTRPTKRSLGEWVTRNSKELNPIRLFPRHASFIAAILVHEGYITNSLKANAVILHFPNDPPC
jgi:hypothetical protein